MFYATNFESLLNEDCGKSYQNASTGQQNLIMQNPNLPPVSNQNASINSISLESLITKFKHRINGSFRIEKPNSHIIIFSASAFQKIPASIVEFNVEDFCNKSEKVADYIELKGLS